MQLGKYVLYFEYNTELEGICVSIDVFQEKIRKTKNPSVLVAEAFFDWVPPQILSQCGNTTEALESYYTQLLDALKGIVPAVRFGFGSFGLLGADGVSALSGLMKAAKDKGYYVLLDAPESLSPAAAKNAAQLLGQPDGLYPCDGVVFSAWLGSDVLKAFLPLAQKGKSLFPVVRAANKSAAEIQDLLTGNRLVHTAAADIISRQGETVVGKCGYSQVGAVAAASAADSLRSLRGKYARMFLLLDGLDYPNSNAKNCSYAFDKLGHGAAACGGSCIAAAWQEEGDGSDYLEKAKQGALRMQKNLTRYITVL